MKATGIVRRVDDLGRVVIPKEIRRTMNIREGEALEIFIEDKKVIFQKYIPSEEDLSEASAKWVKSHAKEIAFVIVHRILKKHIPADIAGRFVQYM